MTSPAPTSELDVAHVARLAVDVCRRNLTVLVPLSALLAAAPSLFVTWTTYRQALDANASADDVMLTSLGGALLLLVSGAVCQTIIAGLTLADHAGNGIVFGDLLEATLRRLPTTIGINFLFSFALTLGAMALVVPGLMIAVALVVATPACVAEGGGAFTAFDRSRFLTRGLRWQVFGLLAAYFGALALFEGILFLLAGGLTVFTNPAAPARLVILPLVAFLSRGISAVGAAVLYLELSRLKGGPHMTEVAQVFD